LNGSINFLQSLPGFKPSPGLSARLDAPPRPLLGARGAPNRRHGFELRRQIPAKRNKQRERDRETEIGWWG
jgi:hypothetical protein